MPVRLIFSLLLLPLLAACNPMAMFSGESVQLPCPQVRVLAEGERYARFRDGEVDPNGLEIEANFLSLEVTCDYDDDDDPASRMVLDLDLVVGVERGPAALATGDQVPYFVALIGPDRQVVERTRFDVTVPAPVAGQLFALAEPEEIRLVFPAGSGTAPWQYEVVVSFQLDRKQLEFQRRNRN
ncbi:MAG: hypothetical protein QGF53_09855 [Alphaproteobacteria bacterium]|nr:hypothetical protein [Alphaproteobacteria bacterium]